jgi:hypothetical protein
MVQLINQVAVLLGVIIGALGSYLTTAATERARWKRALDSRWDDRRVEAYASYAQSVKRMIKAQDVSWLEEILAAMTSC